MLVRLSVTIIAHSHLAIQDYSGDAVGPCGAICPTLQFLVPRIDS
jgi:hypothetical protein